MRSITSASRAAASVSFTDRTAADSLAIATAQPGRKQLGEPTEVAVVGHDDEAFDAGREGDQLVRRHLTQDFGDAKDDVAAFAEKAPDADLVDVFVEQNPHP